jgi:hypothetical protein
MVDAEMVYPVSENVYLVEIYPALIISLDYLSGFMKKTASI